MGPKWPFLLMYGSHDMRHIGFRGLTSCQRDPRDSRRHNKSIIEGFIFILRICCCFSCSHVVRYFFYCALFFFACIVQYYCTMNNSN